MFEIVNRIATEDGQVHTTIKDARLHELTALLGNEPAINSATAILDNWPRILGIMTSEPGKEKPKARKRRSDFGTKRPPKPAPPAADAVCKQP